LVLQVPPVKLEAQAALVKQEKLVKQEQPANPEALD
jgi:hypothetical protein